MKSKSNTLTAFRDVDMSELPESIKTDLMLTEPTLDLIQLSLVFPTTRRGHVDIYLTTTIDTADWDVAASFALARKSLQPLVNLILEKTNKTNNEVI